MKTPAAPRNQSRKERQRSRSNIDPREVAYANRRAQHFLLAELKTSTATAGPPANNTASAVTATATATTSATLSVSKLAAPDDGDAVTAAAHTSGDASDIWGNYSSQGGDASDTGQ